MIGIKISNSKYQISNKYQLEIGYWKLAIGYFRQIGFTLVELLLYMGIFIILLSVFIQLFSSLITTQLNAQATSSVSEDSKYILTRLSYDVSRSQNIVSPAQGVSASTLQLVINNTTYTYTLNNANLVLTNTDGALQLNSTDTTISNLSFTPVGSTSGKFTIQVQFTVTGKTTNEGHSETQVIQTTFGNR